MKNRNSLTLNEKVLLAAVDYIKGDTTRSFTAEELLVEVWKRDKQAFGLRGFENDYPDSNKLYTKIDGKSKGLVAEGFFQKVAERTLKLTEKGLSYASSLQPNNEELQIKLKRELQVKVNKILENQEFVKWLKEKSNPKDFRGAGYFWGVAPGMPPRVVKERIDSIENILKTALKELEKLGTDIIYEEHGKSLFERKDLERCLQFHQYLKKQFQNELAILKYY